MMAIEPTMKQRSQVQALGPGELALAQFLSVREQAYNRYGSRIMPYLISVGGYPDLFGHAAGTLVGDDDRRWDDEWSDFAMVYYPSRQVFLKMMTHTPAKGIYHRDAGLARAVLMPSTDWSLART